METALGRNGGARPSAASPPPEREHPVPPVAGGAPPGLPSEAEVMGRAGGENFSVASRLLPRSSRARLLAFYGYARLVDQLGDDYAGDRLAALDWVERSLEAALDGGDAHPLVVAAAAAVRDAGAGADQLRALIDANRVDQTTTRYASYDDLVGYCRLSANPVGRLVLVAFGAATPERLAWSDAVCTGLQIVEHAQDVAEDALAGRIYLPLDDLGRFGVGEADVAAAGRGAPASAALRGVVAFEVSRARALLLEGVALVASLRGRPRLAVAGFVAGGLAAVDALAAVRFDPFAGAPRASKAAVAACTAAVLLRARRAGGPGRAGATPTGGTGR